MVADGKGNTEGGQGRVSITDLGLLKGGRLGRVLSGSWRAFRAIRRLRPSIVHFHDPELIPLGILLKTIGCRVIYDVHEDVPRQVFSKYYIPRIIRYPVALAVAILERICARGWDAIVPATQIIASTPVIAGRFPAGRTVVVHNFPIGDELLVQTPTPYPQRRRNFAYLGGIENGRGAFEMIRAFEYIDNITDASLELAGWFTPPSLEKELRALPGWPSVKYHGEVNRYQVAQILSEARAGLVVLHPEPTHFESYPIKLFEYMSVGIPVIASDFPIWRRIVDGAGCGLLVDPLNPASIASAMRWVLEHPREAEAMGERGRQAAEHVYNWKTEAVKLLTLYRRLLGT